MARGEATQGEAHPRDLAGTAGSFLLVWGLPVAVLIATGEWGDSGTKLIAWPLALLWMGGACAHNALRCGRRHCFFTGPYFLGMALISLLHGLAIVPLGADGWRWIAIATVVGGVGLTCGPELIWGRYLRAPKQYDR